MAVIDTLKQEHANIAQLLDALESQINILERAGQPDYDVIRGIADYFLEYPDSCHHPKENIVLERLRERCPRDAAAAGDLEGEHRDMSERARRFHDTVCLLLSDADITREAVVDAAHVFIATERRHMKMEEECFFPLAEERLTPEDWSYVASKFESVRDPIFEEDIEEEFKELRNRLLQWQKEFRNG